MALLRGRKKYLEVSKTPVAKPLLGKVRVTVVEYNEQSVTEREIFSFSDCLPFKESPTVTWVNVSGIHEPEIIESAGKIFNLHPLVVADIMDSTYLAKLDDFGKYLFGEIGTVIWDDKERELVMEQSSIVFGANYVITFQKGPSTFFEPILDRIRKKGRICAQGTDYLVYSIIDLAIDSYYKILNHVDTHIERIEDALVIKPETKLLQDIYTLKREMIDLRKVVWPLREIANGLARREVSFIKPTTLPYFRDIHEYTIQIIEMIESSRDLLSGLLDVYLSSQNNRLNEVMKVLTIISTIFLPLMLLASIYGMNFRYMPELYIEWSYPILLIIMAAIAVVMLLLFRRKGWLSNPFSVTKGLEKK